MILMVYLCINKKTYQNRYIMKTTNNGQSKQTALQANAERFAQSLQAVGHHARVKLCAELKRELMQNYKLATVLSYLTEYRKAVVTAFPEKNKALLNCLRPAAAKIRKRAEKYTNKVQMRTETGGQIEIDAAACISVAKGLISSESYLERVVGLLLLTGRRSAEILKTAKFEAVTGKTKTVLFAGQLKKKGETDSPYQIPILAGTRETFKALNSIRAAKPEFAELSEMELNQKCANGLNKYCKKHFADLLGSDCTPHDLRKAYAAIAYKATKNQSFRMFAKAILGHGNGSEIVTETYFKFVAK
jgi:integrase